MHNESITNNHLQKIKKKKNKNNQVFTKNFET